MKDMSARSLVPLALLAALSLTPDAAAPQQRERVAARADSAVSASVRTMLVRYSDVLGDTTEASTVPTFTSQADSLEWVKWRDIASSASNRYQVVVDLFDRTLHVISAGDTLYEAPIAVASGTTLEYAGRKWTFRTPRGERRVLRKVTDPVWSPPDWLYAEIASAYGLKLARLSEGSSVRVQYGYRLTVRRGVVGVVTPDGREFVPLPVDEHIVFNSTLFIPPFGTMNRRVAGELGQFALDMGNGYLIHGTPDQSSIGRAVTHGCIRLADADIEWLYQNVPVGTPVYIY
jgi:lipoprotein-anchoring transpeptidase ErfK/SrfK